MSHCESENFALIKALSPEKECLGFLLRSVIENTETAAPQGTKYTCWRNSQFNWQNKVLVYVFIHDRISVNALQ